MTYEVYPLNQSGVTKRTSCLRDFFAFFLYCGGVGREVHGAFRERTHSRVPCDSDIANVSGGTTHRSSFDVDSAVGFGAESSVIVTPPRGLAFVGFLDLSLVDHLLK